MARSASCSRPAALAAILLTVLTLGAAAAAQGAQAPQPRHSAPARTPTNCTGQPSAVANITWACPAATLIGGNCTRQCANGTIGTVNATCGANGTWGPPAGACRLPNVLLLHSDSSSRAESVQDMLASTGAFAEVELFNGLAETPSLANLTQFDAVLAWSGASWANATALGDVLAQYWDGGGGVVVAVLANLNKTEPLGRWAVGGYQVMALGSLVFAAESAPLNRTEPASPLLVGVTNLTASFAYQSDGAPLANATVVARWGSSNRPLIVRGVRARANGRTGNLVTLNMYPVANPPFAFGWDGGHGARVMANALLYSIL